MTEATEPVAALAAIAAMLVAMFFLFRSLPWSQPGPWRRIWALATLAALLFIIGEVPAVLQPDQPVGGLAHQLPLFGVILTTATAFVATYFESRRGAEREHILGLTDPLTGLRNRLALQERVALALEDGAQFEVLWVDLDSFYTVNDRLGSEAGDAVLKQVGEAMMRIERRIDLAARVGGDAFALYLSAAEESAVRPIAERAVAELERIVPSKGRHLTASFGAAGNADGQTAHQIVENAESAAARASRAGGGHLAYAAQGVVVRLGGSSAPITV